MSDTSLEDEVRGFYEGESLDEDCVQAILDVSTDFAIARRWKRIRLVTSTAIAAMALFAVALLVERSSIENQTSNTVTSDGRSLLGGRNPENADRNRSSGQTGTQDETPYRLVAFRSHGDDCPHCRATGRVFAEVASAFGGPDIAFEQFDLSDARNRVNTDQRIEELDLARFIDGRIETAFLALVQSDGKSIQEFKPSMSSKRIAEMIRESLSRQK